jgi:hypothetical protein
MTQFQEKLQTIAHDFVEGVLQEIRMMPLEALLQETHGLTPSKTNGMLATMARKGGTAARLASAPVVPPFPKLESKIGKNGRLARRSVTDIQAQLKEVVATLKLAKDGMRSEDLRAKLALDKRALPRLLAEGVKTKVLRKKGQKRATTYFVK